MTQRELAPGHVRVVFRDCDDVRGDNHYAEVGTFPLLALDDVLDFFRRHSWYAGYSEDEGSLSLALVVHDGEFVAEIVAAMND